MAPCPFTMKCARILTVMSISKRPKRLILRAVIPLLFVLGTVLLPGLTAPSTSIAASGISITGSFYRQPFQIPQGGSAFGPSIYVVVSNPALPDAEELSVKMVTAAVTSDNVPESGISIGLSRVSFSLQPGAQERIDIRVDVAESVPAGQYQISVTAEPSQGTGGSVVLLPSAGQTASLTVTGESASVVVNAVGPSGQPVIAQVRLFRMVSGSGYEVADSNTGSLRAKVAPGTFSAEAYSLSTGAPLCDPSTFDVAAGEVDKTITLTVRTVYFENDFVIFSNYDSATKKLLNVRTTATVTNDYETMANTEVRLIVTFNADPLEEIRVLGPLPLPVDQTGVQWNYIPAEGWRSGLYNFKYQLFVGGQLMAETVEQPLKVGGGGVASWLWIIFVILGILGTGGLGFLIFFLLKRRKKSEKPEKAEKKRKGEKPARKAEEPLPKPAPKAAEPVRKPEPYRPAEHLRPGELVRHQEPVVELTVEPAPLSSVSSLKARMASLGRDQGMGKEAEEEPDVEEKDEQVETGPMASQPVPVPPTPRIEIGRPAVKKAEEKVQKPPASGKPASQKPGIFSRVTATGKKEPPKPSGAQGPAPVKPGNEVQINWPPKTVEPPKPPSDIQINWPPKTVEPPKPPSEVQINWPPKTVEPPPSEPEQVVEQEMEARQEAAPPEEAVLTQEETATEEPAEPQVPPSRSSFAEAARLRMEARQRSSGMGKASPEPGESQTEGDDSGEGENRPPSP